MLAAALSDLYRAPFANERSEHGNCDHICRTAQSDSSMRIEDALRKETRIVGTHPNERSQPGYIFACVDCKKEMFVTPSKLKRSVHMPECRCRRCNYIAMFRGEPYHATYVKLVGVARYNHVDLTLSFEEFLSFVKIKECHYCGAPIHWSETKGNYHLDRMNNARGYHADNLVVSCKRCNAAKSDHFTHPEWLAIGKIVRTFPH